MIPVSKRLLQKKSIWQEMGFGILNGSHLNLSEALSKKSHPFIILSIPPSKSHLLSSYQYLLRNPTLLSSYQYLLRNPTFCHLINTSFEIPPFYQYLLRKHKRASITPPPTTPLFFLTTTPSALLFLFTSTPFFSLLLVYGHIPIKPTRKNQR